MFKARNLVVVCLVLVALAVPAVGTAAAQSSNEKTKATEVGVTATEIHIAVIADVDNPFAPGLFQGAVDGVKAGAAFLNSKAGGGGLAGRKVVVDFYDSKLNGNESRNATIQGCQNRLCAGRHLGVVPHPGRGHRQLPRTRRVPPPASPTSRRSPPVCPSRARRWRSRPSVRRSTVPRSTRIPRPSTSTRDLRSTRSPSRRTSSTASPSSATTPRMPPAAARLPPSPHRRRASRWTRAIPQLPCRDAIHRACSRPSCRR